MTQNNHPETGTPSNAQEILALVVHDPERSSAPGVKAIRRALIRALSVQGLEPLLVNDQFLRQTLPRLQLPSTVVVIAEGISALRSAHQQLAGRVPVRYYQVVIPTSFPCWGKASQHWTQELQHDPSWRVTYLTDSDLSRSVVEEQLSDYRAEVRVVSPAWGDVSEQEYRSATRDADDYRNSVACHPGPFGAEWSFGAAKVAPPGQTLASSGVSWGFQPAASSERRNPEARPVPNLVQTSEHNRDVVAEMIRPRRHPRSGPHVGILGTKLDFIEELARDYALETGSRVLLDEWPHLSGPPDKERAQGLVNQSDVVLGEWARPNNVWIQENAPKTKRLIVRAHRYEVTTPFPRNIDMERYHAGVVIVPWVGRVLVQKYGWPAEKMVYIPNYVNRRYFSRPKHPGSEYTLGIVGITPDLKRLDLALDLLERLRQVDTRYTLRIRGALPPQHIHWETNPAISQQWGSVLHRLRADPVLRNAVSFDSPGRDMARWFESVGNILSLSDLEGSHVALAEGIASGALPVARDWPGITTLWPAEIVKRTLDEAANWILMGRDHGWRERTVQKLSGHPSLDQDRVIDAWWALINGKRAEAQSYFGPIDWSALTYEPVDL